MCPCSDPLRALLAPLQGWIPHRCHLSPGPWSVAVWFAFQTWGIIRTNRELILGTKVYPKEDRYEFRQVAILELTYIVNFARAGRGFDAAHLL